MEPPFLFEKYTRTSTPRRVCRGQEVLVTSFKTAAPLTLKALAMLPRILAKLMPMREMVHLRPKSITAVPRCVAASISSDFR